MFIHDGDMTLIAEDIEDPKESMEKRKKRNAVTDSRSLWPGGIIPYEFTSSFTGKLASSKQFLS